MSALVNIVAVRTIRSRCAAGASCATALPDEVRRQADDRRADAVDAGAPAVGTLHRETRKLREQRRVDVGVPVRERGRGVVDDRLVEHHRDTARREQVHAEHDERHCDEQAARPLRDVDAVETVECFDAVGALRGGDRRRTHPQSLTPGAGLIRMRSGPASAT
jgi:hypothetical protein